LQLATFHQSGVHINIASRRHARDSEDTEDTEDTADTSEQQSEQQYVRRWGIARLCTNTLLLMLVGIFGAMLAIILMTITPLTDKAHAVGDEALHVADVAKSKITNIDLQISDFLAGGNAKLLLVENATEQINGFLVDGTAKLVLVEDATEHVKNATEQVSIAVATVHELSMRMHLVLDALNQTNTEMRQQMQQTQQQATIVPTE